jgi:protein tyrosine phosphatase
MSQFNSPRLEDSSELTLLLASGVQMSSMLPIAQTLTAVCVSHETMMPVHCAAKVTRGGIFWIR